MELEALGRIVAEWAATAPNVREAYFFGSRVKGTNSFTSDIDVAIALDGDDEGFANWICDAAEMRDSLAVLLPVPLDLQMMHSTDDKVMPAVREYGLRVFKRTGP